MLSAHDQPELHQLAVLPANKLVVNEVAGGKLSGPVD